MIDVIVIALLAVGALFVVVGTAGLLRFPDLPTRLHAVAKADNLGLGFIVVALIVDVVARPDDGSSPFGVAAKLVLIWLLALLGTAANSHLLAGHARRFPSEGTPKAPDAADPGAERPPRRGDA